MPAYDALATVQRQWDMLDVQQREAFEKVLAVFIGNLTAGGAFSPELRVHKLADIEIWSLTWAKDGRALFRYGAEVAERETHIVWKAIGIHADACSFRN
jgi:hypothetical protein